MNTPRTTVMLARAMKDYSFGQENLAKITGLHRSSISYHLTQERPIRDEHIALYMMAMPNYRSALFAAWIKDILPDSMHSEIFPQNSTQLNDQILKWRPSLDDEQRRMLDWWSNQFATDPELDAIFRPFTRKAGFGSLYDDPIMRKGIIQAQDKADSQQNQSQS